VSERAKGGRDLPDYVLETLLELPPLLDSLSL
jgi:hypothetical protein